MQGLSHSQPSAKPSRTAPPPTRGEDVVILRESDAGGDLAAAIARIRADASTARSRILIIGPDSNGAGAADVDVDAAPDLPGMLRRHAARTALVGVGRRLDPLASDLDRLLAECRRELGELDEDIEEGTRARLKHRAKVLQDILGWVGQVATDLAFEAGAAVRGAEPVDLAELAQELVAAREARGTRVRFAVVGECGKRLPVVDAAVAADLLAAAFALAAARIGGAGAVEVCFGTESDYLLVRVAGIGAVRPLAAADLIERIKLRAHELDVELRVDPVHGLAGAALVLAFPLPAR